MPGPAFAISNQYLAIVGGDTVRRLRATLPATTWFAKATMLLTRLPTDKWLPGGELGWAGDEPGGGTESNTN